MPLAFSFVHSFFLFYNIVAWSWIRQRVASLFTVHGFRGFEGGRRPKALWNCRVLAFIWLERNDRIFE